MLESDLVAVGGTKTESAGGTKSESVNAYYEVDFVFDDIELPFVAIYYGRNGTEAKRLYHGILSIKENHIE